MYYDNQNRCLEVAQETTDFFSFRDWISFFSIHAENIVNHQRLGKETSVAPVQSFPRKTPANQLV